MSMDTAHGTPTVLNKDRRTVPQLLAAAAKDTDAASVFYNGTGTADYDSAILVIKGRENVDYVVAMLARQQLVTPGKPVEGAGSAPGPDRVRHRFEHWQTAGDSRNLPAIERSGEGYKLAQTQSDWTAWKAAADAGVAFPGSTHGVKGDSNG